MAVRKIAFLPTTKNKEFLYFPVSLKVAKSGFFPAYRCNIQFVSAGEDVLSEL